MEEYGGLDVLRRFGADQKICEQIKERVKSALISRIRELDAKLQPELVIRAIDAKVYNEDGVSRLEIRAELDKDLKEHIRFALFEVFSRIGTEYSGEKPYMTDNRMYICCVSPSKAYIRFLEIDTDKKEEKPVPDDKPEEQNSRKVFLSKIAFWMKFVPKKGEVKK